ncbi:MAG: GMC oxidoreductase, partial [Pseudomonadales bacterium]
MPLPPDSAQFDIVVIGSGFGGSVTANRLALAGQRVLVLERGPWRDSLPVRSMGVERRSPFPYGVKALTHLLHSLHRGRWDLRLNKAGMYELFSFPGLNVLSTSAVGGGSMAFGGLLEPPREPAFWHDRHPQLDPASIERYYGKIRADMGGVRLVPEQTLPQSVWTHFPDATGDRCHPADPQPCMALLLPPSPAEAGRTVTVSAGLERQYCAFDGDSFLGSRGGAKASVDFVYLAPVLGKGVTVRDLCRANTIQPLRAADGAGYLVHFSDLTTGENAAVRAGRVVLAAGTMNSVRLLFTSSRMPSGLVPMPSLGRTFGGNGDLMAAWSRPTAAVSSFTSTPSQGAFEVDGHEAVSFGLGGFPGVQSLPLPMFVKRRLARMFFLYGMGADSGKAAVTFENDHLQLGYDHRKEAIYDAIRSGLRILASESGDKVRVLGKPLSVHPWGGACLGADADHGVVDQRGEVYGNPGLYIADGAALPSAPGGPPSVAIAAWAH